jgi:hypothetical protein
VDLDRGLAFPGYEGMLGGGTPPRIISVVLPIAKGAQNAAPPSASSRSPPGSAIGTMKLRLGKGGHRRLTASRGKPPAIAGNDRGLRVMR